MSAEPMVTMTIRISKEEKERLQTIAEKNDMSVSHLVRKAIRMLLV